MVGWLEAVDDWGENVALTRSRHLIDGSLSVDSFLCRVDGGDGSLGQLRTPALQKDRRGYPSPNTSRFSRCSVSYEICDARQFPFQLADGPRPYL
jgi:hypothetical protein